MDDWADFCDGFRAGGIWLQHSATGLFVTPASYDLGSAFILARTPAAFTENDETLQHADSGLYVNEGGAESDFGSGPRLALTETALPGIRFEAVEGTDGSYIFAPSGAYLQPEGGAVLPCVPLILHKGGDASRIPFLRIDCSDAAATAAALARVPPPAPRPATVRLSGRIQHEATGMWVRAGGGPLQQHPLVLEREPGDDLWWLHSSGTLEHAERGDGSLCVHSTRVAARDGAGGGGEAAGEGAESSLSLVLQAGRSDAPQPALHLEMTAPAPGAAGVFRCGATGAIVTWSGPQDSAPVPGSALVLGPTEAELAQQCGAHRVPGELESRHFLFVPAPDADGSAHHADDGAGDAAAGGAGAAP